MYKIKKVRPIGKPVYKNKITSHSPYKSKPKKIDKKFGKIEFRSFRNHTEALVFVADIDK